MKVVLIEPEVRDKKAAKVLAKSLGAVSEELEIDDVRLQDEAIEVLTDDPVKVHMVVYKFPGVYRVGVFEKVSPKMVDKALIKVAKKVLRSDMTFELSVEAFGKEDSISLYYDLMDKLIESVDAKPEENRPDKLLRVVFAGKSAYVEYFGLTGPGGLPIGTRGDGIVAFSGGFKSYVASLRACRAGLNPHLVFIHPPGAPKEYVRRAFYKAWTLVRGLPLKEVDLFVARPDERTLSRSGFYGVLLSAIEQVGREVEAEFVILGTCDIDANFMRRLCTSFRPIYPNFGLSKNEMEAVLFDEEDRHKLRWSTWDFPNEIMRFRRRSKAEMVRIRINRGPMGWHEALDRYSGPNEGL